jgi:C-terminal processing protease CtpA/Prc
MLISGRELPTRIGNFAICLALLVGLADSAFADDAFSRSAVVRDLETLHRVLIDSHIAPLAYSSEKEIDDAFAVAKASLDGETLSIIEAYRALQRGASALQNGHTSVDFPVQPYLSYAETGGTLFPLELAFEGGRALIRANYSDNREIQKGDEVTEINGAPVDRVLEAIFPLVSAERRYYATAKIELLTFPRYYWYAFGEAKSFVISLKRQSEQQMEVELPAVKAIEEFEAVRIDILANNRRLEWLDDIAYLNPGAFSGDKEEFDKFLEDAFSQLRERAPGYLVLDLRNNPGGDDAFSDQLVSYLADRPFQWCHHFTVRTSDALKAHARNKMDPASDYTNALLSHPSGSVFIYDFDAFEPQSIDKRFQGHVYALVNRQTHSQAAVTAAQLQDYGWATIVGEETAEYPSLYASLFPYQLPNTGITVQISKGQIVRVSGDESQRGVLPDLVFPDHLLDGEDEILQGLLMRIVQNEPK